MAFLTSFVMNLIAFVILAIITDMLIPNSTFQKYTKFAIGLLLVATMLTPILKVFHMDFTGDIEESLRQISQKDDDLLTSKIKSKKNEINTANYAYILEQMAVQLKNDAEGELMNIFHYRVIDIQVAMKDNHIELRPENIEQITVTVAPDQVEKVEITFDSSQEKSTKKEEITTWLGKRWGVDKEVVQVVIE